MKILIISPRWPWPLNSGGSVAQFGWIDYLRHRHEITLLSPFWGNVSWGAIEKLREIWPEVKLVSVEKPQISTKRTFLDRVKAVLRNLPVVKLAYHALARSVTAAPPISSGRLAALQEYFVTAAGAEARKGYDLIQVEYIEMLSMIHALPPEIPNLFLQIEIHYVVRDRARDDASRNNVYENYVFAQERALELDTLRRYDAVATMSEHDRKTLQDELPMSDIHASPFAFVNSPDQPAVFKISEFADRIVYIGGCLHPPNIDAVQWFLKTMWPLLSAKHPTLKLYIIGEWLPKSKKPFESMPRVIFTGFVEDISTLLQGSIMIVPLRIGSGIRTKILLAMTLGVPVVTTSVGIEGIDARNEVEALLEDEPTGFVAAVSRLIEDQSLNAQIVKNASAFVQSKFSPEATGARRDAIYQMVKIKHSSSTKFTSSYAG